MATSEREKYSSEQKVFLEVPVVGRGGGGAY